MGRIYKREPKKLRRLVGNYDSIVRAAKILNVQYHFADYWMKKKKYPYFHPNPQGGTKWSKFSKIEHFLIRGLVWKKIKLNPLSR